MPQDANPLRGRDPGHVKSRSPVSRQKAEKSALWGIGVVGVEVVEAPGERDAPSGKQPG